MMEKCGNVSISDVSTFQRQATFQSGPKMWKHAYIDMSHLKYGTFQPRTKMWKHVYIAMFPHFENRLLFYSFLPSRVVATTE